MFEGKRFVLSALLCMVVCGASGVHAAEIICEGEYPWHLQGVATDGTNLFWTFTTALVKTDLRGRLADKVAIGRNEGHMGDLCCMGENVFVGMNLGQSGGCRVGDEVWEFNAKTLRLANKHPTHEALWCNNGLEFFDGCFWVVTSAPRHCRYNMVFRYTRNFRFMRCQMIDSGWTNLGVQTICHHGDKILFGCYGDMRDKQEPHPSCIFAVDAKALSSAGGGTEAPVIVPCEKRIGKSGAEGMVVLGGQLMIANSIRLSSPEEKKQRWTARLVPTSL